MASRRRYRMTARRKAALRKAQLASARARKHLRKKHPTARPLTNGQVYAVRAIGVGVSGAMGVLSYQGWKQSKLINKTLANHKAYTRMSF